MAKTNLKQLFSPGALVGKLTGVARRFPVAVACIAALAVLSLLCVHGFEDDINYRWWVFLAFALLSSVAVTLAAEDRWPKWGAVLAGVAVAVLWGVRCLFFPADPDEMTNAQWVEAGVVCGAAFFAIFVAAFMKRDTDGQWWNFSLRTLVRLMLGSIFSGILFGGLLLAIHAVAELFDVRVPDEIFGWLTVACFVVFAPLYVLAGVPDGEAKRDGELRPEPVLKVLALYILGPILALYTLILYLYLGKIVLAWELPNGWVSWLVTALALGGLAVTLLLYPHRMKEEGNRAARFLSRWTGVIILPLLALMTVGIVRRISDYGWTPNRAYILLLNLWFYAVYAWLFVVRGRRVKWIVISATLVALVSSVGPWSLARIPPRPDTESGLPVAEEEGEWFSSDSTFADNTPYLLAGGYDNFAHISWYGDDKTGEGISVTEEAGDLVISIAEDAASDDDATAAREFRVSLREASANREIRGDGFLLLVDDCSGMRYAARDSLDVDHVKGFLFYSSPKRR